MEGKEFWEVEHTDFISNVVIKFKKLSSLDVLDLADRNIGKDGNSKQFKLDCLKNVIWTKNGSDWFPIMDEYGNVSLPECSPSVLLDIFFRYRNTVCLPVFTESRAYKGLMEKKLRVSAESEDKPEKHNKS